MASSSSVNSRLSSPLPQGTWDSHTHVINEDFKKFPLNAAAEYKPHPHSIVDANEHYAKTSGLGLSKSRMVLTQVSIYGTDNSALLEGLRQLGPQNGRGLVEFDPENVTDEQMKEWNELGVRGVRINMVSRSQNVTEDELKKIVGSYVKRVSVMGNWLVELYVPLSYMPLLNEILPQLEGVERTKFVVDHFGGFKVKDDAPKEYIEAVEAGKQADPYLIPNFKGLVDLVTAHERGGPDVYVKLSGQYRVDPSYPSERSQKLLDPIGKELLAKAPERVIWASDWPHTRFESIDSVPFVEMCYKWCGDGEQGQKQRDKFFRTNTERLFDVK